MVFKEIKFDLICNTKQSFTAQVVKVALNVHTNEMAGDILVFLTGKSLSSSTSIMNYVDSGNMCNIAFSVWQVSQRLSVLVTCCMKKLSL